MLAAIRYVTSLTVAGPPSPSSRANRISLSGLSGSSYCEEVTSRAAVPPPIRTGGRSS